MTFLEISNAGVRRDCPAATELSPLPEETLPGLLRQPPDGPGSQCHAESRGCADPAPPVSFPSHCGVLPASLVGTVDLEPCCKLNVCVPLNLHVEASPSL